MRTVGIFEDHVGVRHVPPPSVRFGNWTVESSFPLGIEVEDHCFAHSSGDAYKVDGLWCWRTTSGVLVRLESVHRDRDKLPVLRWSELLNDEIAIECCCSIENEENVNGG